jgi:Arc/MetJ-type ribon-helix-helix transcriptional regulator
MPQKKHLQRLMKSRRWNSESEIVRYGIELVRRELEREELSPYPETVLTQAYKKLSKQDRELDDQLGRASVRPEQGELA